MEKGKSFAIILSMFVVMPIWFYLLHWLLKTNNAGELQMFLFWAYVPVAFIATILIKIYDD